jgi:hypothetical protein
MGPILNQIVSTILLQVLQQILQTHVELSQNVMSQEYQTQLQRLPAEDKLLVVKTWAAIHLEVAKKFKQHSFFKGVKSLL